MLNCLLTLIARPASIEDRRSEVRAELAPCWILLGLLCLLAISLLTMILPYAMARPLSQISVGRRRFPVTNHATASTRLDLGVRGGGA